ncbi:MAG: hypothetical protein ACE5IO_06880, partial [Thermoplasmata archaeon]
ELGPVALLSGDYVPSYSQVTRDVDFTFGKSFNADNNITHPDFAERSASHINEQIDDFLPNGLQRVTDVDIYYTDVSIHITQLHVIEDQELIGPGEIFFEFLLNRDRVNHEYRDDNNGNYYVTDDGTYLDVDILLTDYLYSMNGSFSVEIHGKESDLLGDAYLGGALLYWDLTGYTSVTSRGWLPLNYYPPVGGINPLQIEVYLELEFTNIEVFSYPTDFPTTYDGSWLISAVYFPKVHYFEMGAPPPHIKNVYEQVYYGYDPSIGTNAYLIYYMFYWDFEMEDIVNLGHYYDYEPLLMYVQEIGLEPYRIVFRNKGSLNEALPSRLVIQDAFAVPHSGSFVADVSPPLMPLLGNQSTGNYQCTDIYFNTPAHHYETDHGLTPFMTVPHMTINDAFHQMEVGVPLLSSEADLTPLPDYLVPMTNDVIREGYARLDEAFNSNINVYEFQNFWGGEYSVPYNMSLTLDMLHNPFEFPYIVDCWEDIVHFTEAKQEYKANGFYYDIDLDLSFSVPATVTFDIPTQVTAGQTYDIGIDLALDPEDITISFAYDIYLEYVLHWWFIGFEESVTYSGQCDFAVNLNDISDFISFIGLSSEDIMGTYHGGWLTVTDFSTSTDLLSTMLDCSVEIHLLRILTDLLGTTGVGKLVDILKIFLADVDLIASPTISGYVTTEVLTENSAISLDTNELVFDEGTTQKSVQMTVLGGTTQTGIRLANMQYHIEFSTDWDIEFDFTDTLNYFVQDLTFSIGTFPTITASSDDHDIAAETTTGYDQGVTMSIVVPSTTTTSSNGGFNPPDGLFGLPLILGISGGTVAIIAVIVVLRRRD